MDLPRRNDVPHRSRTTHSETLNDEICVYEWTTKRYYRSYPVVLVRLSRIDRDALRDLLSMSRRLTLAKTRYPRARARVD